MQTLADFVVRNLRPHEISIPIDWAASEGWNPGLHDAEAFFAADPKGFFVGEVDGQAVAVISGVKYPGNFGFLGLYIVKPDFRHKGYGSKIFAHAMAYLAGCNIGLDGVLAQEKNYERVGFKTEYGNIRHRLVGKNVAVDPQVHEISGKPTTDIFEFDRRRFPAARQVFLRSWLTLPGHRAFKITSSKGLEGFGVIRPCKEGFKIGPLFATNAAHAEKLLLALLGTAPGQNVYFDTPAPNVAAVDVAQRHGGQKVFETVRMYNRGQPAFELNQVFGVTSFELG